MKEIPDKDIKIVIHIPGIFFRVADIWLIHARFFQGFKFTNYLLKTSVKMMQYSFRSVAESQLLKTIFDFRT
jgi:hypothetical protein